MVLSQAVLCVHFGLALAAASSVTPAAKSAPPPTVRAEASGLGIGDLVDKAGGFELRLYAGGVAGAAPQVTLGAGGMPTVSMGTRVLWGFVEPEITLGYGAFAGAGALTGARDPIAFSHLRVSIGSRFILNLDVARPFLWLGYSHIHETRLTDIIRDPVGTTLTTSRAVAHRSGAEVGLGLLLPFDVDVLGATVRLETYARATAMVLPQLDRLPGLQADPLPVKHDGYLLFELGLGVPVLG
jgi:hypothetical protein